MAIEYLGLSSVEGPLVVLEGVQDAFYDEIVEFVVDHKTKKMGRIVELNEDNSQFFVSARHKFYALLKVICSQFRLTEAASPFLPQATCMSTNGEGQL